MYRFSLKNTADNTTESQGKQYPRGMTYRYNEVIREVGFGQYQYKIIATIAMVNVSLGIFAGLLPFLIPLVKIDIELRTWEVGMLIAAQSLGSMLGGVLFSYLSDLKGRKLSLIGGLFTTILCSIL